MKINITDNSMYLHGLKIPTHAIILQLDNGIILTSWKFNHKREYDLEVMCYNSVTNSWIKKYMKNQYTEILWTHHRKNRRRSYTNYAQLMKHDRVHKKSGGGTVQRDYVITDYECTKNPLHDFRRVNCINWN